MFHQTNRLTTGQDVLTGAAGNDTFFALNTTLQAGDSVNGGAGTDTLFYTDASAAGANLVATALSSIENLYVQNVAGTTTAGTKETVTLVFSAVTGTTTAASTVTIDGTAVAIAAIGATATAIEVAQKVASTAFTNFVVKSLDGATVVLEAKVVGDLTNLTQPTTVATGGAFTAPTMAIINGTAAVTTAVTQTVDATTLTDTVQFWNNGSTGAVTFDSIQQAATIGVKGVTAGANATTTANFATAMTKGTADSVSIALDGNTSAGTITIGAGFETVNVSAAGKNTVAGLVTGAKTVNISGAGDLTITATIADATKIDGSAATGKLDVESAVNKVTISTGTGADKIELSHAATVALEATVNAGAGNDVVTITSLNEAADLVDDKVTLDGGAGEDTLVMINALASELGALSAVNLAKKGISNFEKLSVSDLTTTAAIDVTKLGISYLDLAAGQGANATFTLLDNSTLALGAAASDAGDTATIAVKDSALAGSNNSFTLVLDAAHAAGAVDYGKLSVANVETVTINSATTKSTALVTADTNVIDVVAANATSLIFTGNTTLDLSGDAFDGVAASANASAFTGTTITTSFAGGVAVTYTGSAMADVIIGSSNGDVINGGAGKDTITGGAGADIITTGAGADTIKINTVGDSTSSAMDKITDFTLNSDILHTIGNIDDSDTQARTASTLESAASGTDVKAATSETDTDVTASITAGGKITVAGAEAGNVDTLAEWIAVAEIMLSSATSIATDDVASSIGFFEFGGNTYVVEETTTDASNTETVTVQVIELSGLTGAIGISTSELDNYILIA